jgi:hypothetical protein
MSSHWAWAERVIKNHNKEKPFAPENGQPLRYKIGDKVIFTNEYGVEFSLSVTGYYEPEEMTAQYALGKRYMLDWDCPWMPVAEASLSPIREAA